jgi:mannosyltransferase OCH1-like enzyme
MDYKKSYLIIVIIAFVVSLFVIRNITSLETTWLGVYNSEGNIQRETKNEYSNTFFSKKQCETWIRKRKENVSAGIYVCGKNCSFKITGLINCEKIFEY